MANNGNEMVDSDTNYTEQIDRIDYSSNISNAPDESSSTSEKSKFFPKILKYLMRSTVRIIQNKRKKLNVSKRSVSTLRKSEEKITKCTSLSSIVNKIKSDAETAVNIEKKMIDAVTSTTRLGEVFDKVTHENLLGIVEHLVRDASAKYTEKYIVDNAVKERSCGPLCVGIGTQSDTVDREFSTSPDAFAKACEERRHADFILGEIAKISDALTEEKVRLVSVKEQASSILTSISVTSMRFQIGEETFKRAKPLISSIIHAEEKPTVASATITVMQPETPLTDSQVLASTSDFASESQISTDLDESLNTSDFQVISPLEHLRKTEPTPTTSVMYPERDDFQDTEIVREKIKEEEESLTINSVSPTLDKHAVENDYASINSVIVSCIPKLKRTMSKCLDLYQPKDDQTDASKRNITNVKDGISKSSLKKGKSKPTKDKPIKAKSIKDKQIKVKPIKDKKLDKRKIKTIKDILPKSVPFKYKKPKYRAKYRVDEPPKIKMDTVSKKALTPSDKIPTYGYISPPSKPIKTRSFNYFERPMEMYQDCRSKPLRRLQPIGHCENLRLSNMCLGRPKYCDGWTVQCFNSQNDIRNAYCRPLHDSCATEYCASCHSLIDSSRYNINDCAKPRVTFGNSYANSYCKNNAKYYYPHLNNIDNVRMGYFHCNDSCPVRDNNQHCGRDRSYYWTKGNLYFTHPWTSEHLL